MGKMVQMKFDLMCFKSLVDDQYEISFCRRVMLRSQLFSSVEITYGFKRKPFLPHRFRQVFSSYPYLHTHQRRGKWFLCHSKQEKFWCLKVWGTFCRAWQTTERKERAFVKRMHFSRVGVSGIPWWFSQPRRPNYSGARGSVTTIGSRLAATQLLIFFQFGESVGGEKYQRHMGQKMNVSNRFQRWRWVRKLRVSSQGTSAALTQAQSLDVLLGDLRKDPSRDYSWIK